VDKHERRTGAAEIGGQTATRLETSDRSSQARDRGVREDHSHGDRKPETLFELEEKASGRKGRTAEVVEEVVLRMDRAVEVEDVSDQAGHHSLLGVQVANGVRFLCTSIAIRRGQTRRVDLAAAIDRERSDANES
jgi:hypothetical protein